MITTATKSQLSYKITATTTPLEDDRNNIRVKIHRTEGERLLKTISYHPRDHNKY